jgi:hypothetical protein
MFMFAYWIEMVVIAALFLDFGFWFLVFGLWFLVFGSSASVSGRRPHWPRSTLPKLESKNQKPKTKDRRPKTKDQKPKTKSQDQRPKPKGQTTNDDDRMATNFGHHS